MTEKNIRPSAVAVAGGIVNGQLEMIEKAYGKEAALEVAMSMINHIAVRITKTHGIRSAYNVLQGNADGLVEFAVELKHGK